MPLRYFGPIEKSPQEEEEGGGNALMAGADVHRAGGLTETVVVGGA